MKLTDRSKTPFIDVRDLVDYYEHLLRLDSSAKDWISPWVATIFSEIALTAELTRQLDLYHPWASTFNQVLTKEQTSAQFERLHSTMKEFMDSLPTTNLQEIGTSIGKKFHYPVGSRSTKETVAALRSAERNLDAFWERIDATFVKNHGKTLDGLLRRYVPAECELQRTAEWIEPTQSHT